VEANSKRLAADQNWALVESLSKPINNPNSKLKSNFYEVVLVRNTGRAPLTDRRVNSGARRLHDNTMPRSRQKEAADRHQG
jgi:hypothetical protein